MFCSLVGNFKTATPPSLRLKFKVLERRVTHHIDKFNLILNLQLILKSHFKIFYAIIQVYPQKLLLKHKIYFTTHLIYSSTLDSRIIVPPPIVNFSIFFHPGHLHSTFILYSEMIYNFSTFEAIDKRATTSILIVSLK